MHLYVLNMHNFLLSCDQTLQMDIADGWLIQEIVDREPG